MNSASETRKRLSLDEINTVLSGGFPDPDKPEQKETLLAMPFGRDMCAVVEKKNEQGKFLHRDHIFEITTQMNRLLQGDPRSIIVDRDDVGNMSVISKWVIAWSAVHEGIQSSTSTGEAIWRIEAFLHDVGKSLTRPKHAERGGRLVDRLRMDERDHLRALVGKDYYNQILKVINFHDRFGVLSTGEASYGILADAVDPGMAEEHDAVKKAAQTLSHIMIVNLIDIGASVDWKLKSYKVRTVLDDWERVCWDQLIASDQTRPRRSSRLKESGADVAIFERLLLDLAAQQAPTIARIERLLSESYRRAQTKKKGDRWSLDADEIDFRSAARQALETAVPLITRQNEFRVDFAHVVKMDYLLYLVEKLTLRHWEKYGDPYKLATILMQTLQALVEHFKDLSRSDTQRMRIGIDLGVLASTPEVGDQIADLLVGDGASVAYGLDWLKKEVGAWPF